MRIAFVHVNTEHVGVLDLYGKSLRKDHLLSFVQKNSEDYNCIKKLIKKTFLQSGWIQQEEKMKSKSMRSETVVATALCLSLTSCAYFQPYVLPPKSDYCPNNANSKACEDLRGVTAAQTNINQSADNVKEKFDGTFGITTVNRALGMTTFVLVTALAVKTAHNASVNSIKNIGLGAGTTYAGSTLFTANSTESLYMATHASLICLAGRAQDLMATYDSGKDQLSKYERSNIVKAIINPACMKNAGAQETLMKSTRTAYDNAITVLQKISSSDGALGRRLSTAANNLLLEMNKQLLTNAPNLDAIVKSARSESSIVSGFAPSSKALQSPNSVQQVPETPPITPEVCPVVPMPSDEELTKAKNAFESVTMAAAQQINSIGDLSSGCTITGAVPIKPLTVQQTEVSLTPGAYFNASITGGRPPYTADWSGEGPDETKSLSKSLAPESSILRLTEPATGGEGSYTVVVSDSAVVPSSVTIKVHTQPAPTPTKN
jgi:hypothetical protein